MNRQELKRKLDELGVEPGSYSLNGDLLPDALVLYENYEKWEVFYFDERGNRDKHQYFKSEPEACRQIYQHFTVVEGSGRINEPSEQLNRNLKVVNDVFQSLSQPPLHENDHFIQDDQFSSEHAIRFALEVGQSNNLPIDIYVESSGIRIDIFDIPESFEWDIRSLENTPRAIEKLLVELLTGFSVVEFCGSPHSFSRLFIFGKEGHLLSKYPIRGIFNVLSTWKCERRLFHPLY